MNDRHPKDLLSAYLDGEVTTAERIEVARHLEACVECGGVLDDFRAMAAAASQEPPPPVPAGLQARIMAALRTQSPESRQRSAPWFPIPLAVAAGLVVVAAGGWALLRRRPEPDRPLVAQSAPAAVMHEAHPALAPPPPPPPSKAGAPTGKKEASDQLQSLGYIESDRPSGAEAKEKAPGAGPESTGDRLLSHQAQPASPETAPPSIPAGLADAAAKTTEAGGSEAASEPRAGRSAPMAEPTGRSIVFEFEGVEGTLNDAGLVTLARGSGRCSVDLSEARATDDEVRFIFGLASPVTAPQAVARLDQTRAQEGVREMGAPPGAAGSRVQEGKDGRSVRVLRVLPSAQRPLEPSEVARLEESLRRLLDVTAREVITARCGAPPPRSPHRE
jgi:hypothetical protein